MGFVFRVEKRIRKNHPILSRAFLAIRRHTSVANGKEGSRCPRTTGEMHPIRMGIFTAVNATTGGGLLTVAPNPQKPHMRLRLLAPLGLCDLGNLGKPKFE